MPELPEVEQVKNSLREYIKNKTITKVIINIERLIKHPSPAEFIKNIQGRSFVDLERFGKYLVFTLDNRQLLIIHLRMTGSLIYKQNNEPVNKPRIIFELNEGTMYYCDTRTLGTIHLISPEEKSMLKGLYSLGAEPISPDFTVEYLRGKFIAKKRLVKAALLDQSIIAGLGNIYVDEALAKSKIHPKRLTNSLSEQELADLHLNIKEIIQAAIANRGTTFRDYKDADGNKGSNQEHLFVYGRSGQACKRCGAILVYEKVAGRGTVYCPQCQQP